MITKNKFVPFKKRIYYRALLVNNPSTFLKGKAVHKYRIFCLIIRYMWQQASYI